jgi:hypothetical protein
VKHVGKQFVPLGVRNYQQQRERGEPLGKRAAGFIGITPAPSYVNQTEAEKLAASLAKDLPGTRTEEEFDRSKLKRDLARTMRTDRAGGNQQAREAVRAGTIFPQDVKRYSQAVTRNDVAASA